MSESTNTPTVVLVHGGFVDSSYWAPVIEDLQAHDVPVLAPANPLRGLAHDAEYVASYVNQIDGPVLLVGHSYGGAVISVAGASTPDAVGLVYVAAFALDEGESGQGSRRTARQAAPVPPPSGREGSPGPPSGIASRTARRHAVGLPAMPQTSPAKPRPRQARPCRSSRRVS